MTRPALNSFAASSVVLAAAAASRTRATSGSNTPLSALSHPMRGSDAPFAASARTSVRSEALRTSGLESVEMLSRRASTGRSAAATASLSPFAELAAVLLLPKPPVASSFTGVLPTPFASPAAARPSARATSASAALQRSPTAVSATFRSVSWLANAARHCTASSVCCSGIDTRRSDTISRAHANAGCSAAGSSSAATAVINGRISFQPDVSDAPLSSRERRHARSTAARRTAPPLCWASGCSPAAYTIRSVRAIVSSNLPAGACCRSVDTALSN
mmetsp:Transcript_8958/g.36563  ORF Transcript_8958/g.36563 Transcript_8958/m.36563 type:complete len:275 (-) Transcript_8958:795-1619(-)